MAIPAYTEKNFSSLEEKIGLTFKNPDILVQALVHRSFLNENRDFALPQNERLEFLGDAVLELVVTKFCLTTTSTPKESSPTGEQH